MSKRPSAQFPYSPRGESVDSSSIVSEQELAQMRMALYRARAEQAAADAAAAATMSASTSLHPLVAPNIASLRVAAPLAPMSDLARYYAPTLYQPVAANRPLTDLEILVRHHNAVTAANRQAQLLLPNQTAYSLLRDPAVALGTTSASGVGGFYQQNLNILQNPLALASSIGGGGTTNATFSSLNLPSYRNSSLGFVGGGGGGGARLVSSLVNQAPAVTSPTAYVLHNAQRLSMLDGSSLSGTAGMNFLSRSPLLATTMGVAPGVTAASAGQQQGVARKRDGATTIMSPKRKKRKYEHESFPEKLHRLIREAKEKGKDNIVKFSDDGTVFSILDTSLFEKEILPHYFRHNNISSFKRLLRMYKFKKLHGTWMQGTFENPLFHRDHPEWCKQMDRMGNNDGGTTDNSCE